MPTRMPKPWLGGETGASRRSDEAGLAEASSVHRVAQATRAGASDELARQWPNAQQEHQPVAWAHWGPHERRSTKLGGEDLESFQPDDSGGYATTARHDVRGPPRN